MSELEMDLRLARQGDYPGVLGVKRMADTISALRAENEKLNAEVERWVKAHGIAFDQAMENGSAVTALRAELAEARETIIAFAGPWAMQYAQDYDMPDGHLHPTHYDILAKAGARMDDFTRAALTQTKDTTDG